MENDDLSIFMNNVVERVIKIISNRNLIMKMKWKTLFCFILHVAFVLCKINPNNADNIHLTNVERNIDISSQLVKVSTSMTVENIGSSPANILFYAVEPTIKSKLSFISAVVRIFITNINNNVYF